MNVRVVSRFSCGVASAVATKLALRKYGHERVEITYCDPGSEHPDNKRFLADCELWFAKKIVVLKSDKYVDTWDVWQRERFIASQQGAPCTGALKREPAYAFERPGDILVIGYTADLLDVARAARIRAQNFERVIETPLIEAGLTKSDCLALVERAGIGLPEMYLLGFQNNNCIGCPKGGRGYWNMIRKHFPADFARMAALQRELDVAFWVEPDGTRVYLDQLDPNRGVQHTEPNIDCSILCHLVEQDIA